ncbi:hypothetical protein [Nostoc sp.]|uniref:hypothetical protein n=1 Tax=Nostoc sp. TaxID=1180 RepID=UPI002FF9936A
MNLQRGDVVFPSSTQPTILLNFGTNTNSDRFIIVMSTTGVDAAVMKQIHKYLSQFS